jgi:hypothetical protein
VDGTLITFQYSSIRHDAVLVTDELKSMLGLHGLGVEESLGEGEPERFQQRFLLRGSYAPISRSRRFLPFARETV